MIDTNILLDWLLDRDPSRSEQINILFSKSKEIQIADLAIVELVFALEKYYEFPRKLVSLNLEKVLDEPVFNCNRTLFYQVLDDYLERTSLSFIDCCLLQCAKLQNDLPLWTFDKKLINQSSGRAKLIS